MSAVAFCDNAFLEIYYRGVTTMGNARIVQSTTYYPIAGAFKTAFSQYLRDQHLRHFASALVRRNLLQRHFAPFLAFSHGLKEKFMDL